MTKIGIIRCQETAIAPSNHRCAGWNCFPAISNKDGNFSEYDTIELIGFDTCGGCPGGKNADKIVERGLKLKEKGAEVIHLGNCLVGGCPNKDTFVAALEEKVDLPIKERTHGGPKMPPGATPPPIPPEGSPPPSRP